MSITKQIEDAETKDQLEALGLKAFGADVDKRKGIETIRAELAELAEAQQADSAGEGLDPQEHADAQQGQDATRSPESQEGENPGGGNASPAPSAGGEPTKPSGKGKSYPGRQLKHRKTGRLMPWTAQLAKKRDMQEV